MQQHQSTQTWNYKLFCTPLLHILGHRKCFCLWNCKLPEITALLLCTTIFSQSWKTSGSILPMVVDSPSPYLCLSDSLLKLQRLKWIHGLLSQDSASSQHVLSPCTEVNGYVNLPCRRNTTRKSWEENVLTNNSGGNIGSWVGSKGWNSDGLNSSEEINPWRNCHWLVHIYFFSLLKKITICMSYTKHINTTSPRQSSSKILIVIL